MTVLIVPVTLQILSLYTGIIPRYIWTEEIARFCFIWIVMIGAMIAVRDGTHFDVDVLPKLSHKVEAGLRIFVHVAMLLASLIFVTYGYQFAQFGAIQTSEIAGLPMLSIYIAWPHRRRSPGSRSWTKNSADVRILRGEMPPPSHEIAHRRIQRFSAPVRPAPGHSHGAQLIAGAWRGPALRSFARRWMQPGRVAVIRFTGLGRWAAARAVAFALDLAWIRCSSSTAPAPLAAAE